MATAINTVSNLSVTGAVRIGGSTYSTSYVAGKSGQYKTATEGDHVTDYSYRNEVHGAFGVRLFHKHHDPARLYYGSSGMTDPLTHVSADMVYPLLELSPSNSGDTALRNFVGPEIWDAVRNEAQTRALSALDERKIQGWVALGEWDKLTRSLSKEANALRGSLLANYGRYGARTRKISQTVRELRKIPPNQRVARALSIVTDLWLEYTYAVTPTLKDVGGIIAAMRELSLNEAPISVAKGYSKYVFMKERYFSPPGGAVTSVPYSGYPIVGWCAARWQIDSKVAFRSQESVYDSFVDFFTSRALGDMFDMDWSGVIPAAYELVPYSFLVSYFANLDDLLQFNIKPITVQSGYRNTRLTLLATVGAVEVTRPATNSAVKIYSQSCKPQLYGGKDPFYFIREAIGVGPQYVALQSKLPSLRQQANMGFLGISKLLPKRIIL